MSSPRRKRPRTCTYQCDGIVQKLADCFPKDGPLPEYESRDMRADIDNAGLLIHGPALAALIEIDKRGGFFRQTDVKDALVERWAHRRSELLEWGLKRKCSDFQQTMALMTYVFRVMLSHVRERCDQFNALASDSISSKNHPQWLRDIYDKIEPVQGDDQMAAEERRPHPCFAFRADEDSPGGVEQDAEVPEIIFKYIEPVGTEMRAFALLSDGDRLEADGYADGGTGFAVATFKTAGVVDTMITEIPSLYISADKKKLMTPEPVAMNKGGKMKKPAAAKGGMMKKPAAAKAVAKKPAAAEKPDAKEEEETKPSDEEGASSKEADAEDEEGDEEPEGLSLDDILQAGLDLLPQEAADTFELEPGKKTYTHDPNTEADYEAMVNSASKIQITLARAKQRVVRFTSQTSSSYLLICQRG